MSATLIAGMLAIFAVSLIGLSLLVGHDTGGAVGHGDGGLFKTGNPNLGGDASTLGMHGGGVHLPATLEVARKGVGT
jgi:hypothetical protein